MPGTRCQTSPDRYQFVALMALIIWAPLPLGGNRVWAWSLMVVWVYLIAAGWLLLYLPGKVHPTPVFAAARPMMLLFGLWLLWILFQITPLPTGAVALLSSRAAAHYGSLPQPSDWITLSVEPHATRAAFLKSLAYVSVFWLVLLLVTTRQRLKVLAYVLILSGLFQAVYGSIMTMSGLEYGFLFKKTTSVGHVSGTFTNRNHLAGYLEMCLAVGTGVMIANLDSGTVSGWRARLHYLMQLLLSEKFRLRLSLVIMVIALVMTRSRMGNSAFFMSLLFTGGLALILSRHATRATIILIASLVIIDILIVGTWFGVEKVVERLEQTTLATEHRPLTYAHISDQWRDYPVTGSGLGSFYAVFPNYKGEIEAGGFYRHAHNDYLEFAGETGIIGISLLGVAVLLSFATAVFAQQRRHDPLLRGISFGSIMGITAIMIHSSVDFNLQIPANAMTFMLLLAMAWLSLYLKHSRPNSL